MSNEKFLKTKIEPNTSCAKCNKAYCCKWTKGIDISNDEWNKLIPYIDNSVIAKMRLAILNKEKYNSYDCAFLEDNKCMVYENRPLVCKLHYVTSIKKYCNSKKYPYRDIDIVDKVSLYTKLPSKEPMYTNGSDMIKKYKQYIKEI